MNAKPKHIAWVKTLLVGALAAFSGHLAVAQTGIPSSGPIEQLFETWQSNGVLDGALKVKPARLQRFVLPMSNGDLAAIDASHAIAVPLFYPIGGRVDVKAKPVLQDIVQKIKTACVDSGGELSVTPGKPSPPDATLGLAKAGLLQESLYGTFVCTSAARQLFQIDIFPEDNGRSQLLSLGFDWHIFISLMNRQQIDKKEEVIANQRVADEQFRGALAPGGEVAVVASDVPQSLLPKLDSFQQSFLKDKQYRMCGMVVEVRNALVQVQIDQGVFFIPAAKLYPVKLKSDAKRSVPHDWSSWCLKS